MTLGLEDQVERALQELAETVQVEGPFSTENHTNYVITGLLDTEAQMRNVCWCLLGFVGSIYTVDLAIDAAIGTGATARGNLLIPLRRHLYVGEQPSPDQKRLERDPLLQELVAHVLVHLHRRKSILPEWLSDVKACRPPHLSANHPGLDLIAVAAQHDAPFVVIGEMKAYENDPWDAFVTACAKFSDVREGLHHDEIREVVQHQLNNSGLFTKQQIGNNIWNDTGRFGAVIGCDTNCGVTGTECCQRQEVERQDATRLFLVVSPYGSMRDLFDKVCEKLLALAMLIEE